MLSALEERCSGTVSNVPKWR